METQKTNFEAYALVELFGHQRIAGKVSERQIAGAAFVQVDVLTAEGEVKYTRFFNPTAIYGISPASKEIVLAFSNEYSNPPFTEYSLQRKFPELTAGETPRTPTVHWPDDSEEMAYDNED